MIVVNISKDVHAMGALQEYPIPEVTVYYFYIYWNYLYAGHTAEHIRM